MNDKIVGVTEVGVVPAGKIEWTGFKRVLIHTIIIAGVSALAYIVSLLQHFDFGSYQAIATVVLGFLVTLVEKLSAKYTVPLSS